MKFRFYGTRVADDSFFCTLPMWRKHLLQKCAPRNKKCTMKPFHKYFHCCALPSPYFLAIKWNVSIALLSWNVGEECIDGYVAIKYAPSTSANELRRIESGKSATFVACDFCVGCCTGEYYIKRFAQSGAFLLAPSASRRLRERTNTVRERGARGYWSEFMRPSAISAHADTMAWRNATWDDGVLLRSAPIMNTLSAPRVCVIYRTVMSHKRRITLLLFHTFGFVPRLLLCSDCSSMIPPPKPQFSFKFNCLV